MTSSKRLKGREIIRNVLDESFNGPKAMLRTAPPLPNQTFVEGVANGRFEPNLPNFCNAPNGCYCGRKKPSKTALVSNKHYGTIKKGRSCLLSKRGFARKSLPLKVNVCRSVCIAKLALEGNVPNFQANFNFTAVIFDEVFRIEAHGAPCRRVFIENILFFTFGCSLGRPATIVEDCVVFSAIKIDNKP